MKRIVLFPICFFLCTVLALISPKLSGALKNMDDNVCFNCHGELNPYPDGEIHSNHADKECDTCHDGPGELGNVGSASCLLCHPEIDSTGCDLVNTHGGDCLTCHIFCDETEHINMCMECHIPDELHTRSGHLNCLQCHEAPGGDSIEFKLEPSTCINCHPSVNPDACNSTNYHNSLCSTCHISCADKTTTTTTASTSEKHIEDCTGCHDPNDLHKKAEHSDCAQCHDDKGVLVSKCTACHPTEGPGKCGLANKHGSGCLSCHSECEDGTTTTTEPPFAQHFEEICIECHNPDDLHTKPAHHDDNNCEKCHDADGVELSKCTACHPTDGPGKCNLASKHGSGCLSCHSECKDGTTTTTASPPPLVQHFEETCIECHNPNDLHTKKEHGNCAQCHQNNSVEVGKCAECHPIDGPGKCSLAAKHNEACLECHSDCSGPTTTTTAPAWEKHFVVCLTCHRQSALHEKEGHTDCFKCHGQTPQRGNVLVTSCAVCHTFNKPGKCSLTDVHDFDYYTECQMCHEECANTTSSTTTTISTSRCFVEEIYGEDSKETELIRIFRDNSLKNSGVGKKLIDLYYKLSPLINNAIENDEELKKQVKKVVDRLIPIVMPLEE